MSEKSYGVLMLPLPKYLFCDLHTKIKKEDLTEDGIEESPHITMMYGFHTNHAELVFQSVRRLNIHYVDVLLTKLSMFDNPKYDVLKYDVESPQLHDINKHLKSTFLITNEFPDYIPHATIAYLKKGKGKKYIKELATSVIRAKVYNMEFSSASRERTYGSFIPPELLSKNKG